MAAKKTDTLSPENLEAYTSLILLIPGVEIKGASMPYTSLNGNMFSFLKDGVVSLRLGEKDREVFLKKFKSRLHVAFGVVMKEYVEIPENSLQKTKDLKPYVLLSYAYAKTLKAKPGKKK